MNLSMKWLADYVDCGVSVKEFCAGMTMSGSKVETYETEGDAVKNVIVGKLVSITPHENSDHLQVCQVDVGGDAPIQIVTGAQNIVEGALVPVAMIGADLPGGVHIKKGKLRGVESNGMLCSLGELGLTKHDFPYAIEDGIFLIEEDCKPGQDIHEAIGLNDTSVEFEITSNRPDCLSVVGLAREAAVTFGKPLNLKAPEFHGSEDKLSDSLSVAVENAQLCPRYIAGMVKNVKIGPSPRWMRERLRASGVRPINNLVDITNYVMLATGQPTHAFDSDNIQGHIIVRRAQEGEKLLLLNGKDLSLSADDLVIADDAGVVALAGVMGGAKDSILPTTHKVILEVANFNAAGVRRTALRYDNRTEASSRYEKAIDPQRCDQALELAAELFRQLYPEVQFTGLVDHYPAPMACKELDVALSWLERRLGKPLTQEDVSHKLGLLGFTTSFSGDTMHVTVPSWRSTGDVSIQADIMEEVARMYGYENFEAAPITTSFDGAINQLDKDLERRIKEYLAIRCGLQEIFTYPWMDEQYVNAILQDTTGILSLSTPPSPTEKMIRSSLLPNLCKAVVKNERYFTDFSLFETAQVFRDENYTAPYDEREKLPSQRKHLGAAFVGSDKDITTLFRRAKGVVEAMPRYTHMEDYTLRQVEKPVWADTVVWLNLYLGEEHIGDLALLSKKVSMECGIKNLAVMLLELDMDALIPFRSRTNAFTHLPEYPMTDYDVSVLVDGETRWDAMRDAILEKRHELLHGVSFVDEYRGKQVPEGKKSVTLRLTIGSAEKTLTSQEIEACAASAVKRLAKHVGAELRGK